MHWHRRAHRPPALQGSRQRRLTALTRTSRHCAADTGPATVACLAIAFVVAGAVWPVYVREKSAAAQHGLSARTRHGLSRPDHRHLTQHRRSRRCAAGSGPSSFCVWSQPVRRHLEYTARIPVYLVAPNTLAVAGALPPSILSSPTGCLSRWESGAAMKPERASLQVACSAVPLAWPVLRGSSTQWERVQLRRIALARVPGTA